MFLSISRSFAQQVNEREIGKPVSVIDLADENSIKEVNGEWRYSDAHVIEVHFKAPGIDRKPTGATITTNDITPKAGAKDFDDSKWEVIPASSLDKRRGTGKVSFNWYRLSVTLPEKINEHSIEGNTVYFEIVVDDYAEVWIDGMLNKMIGQKEGSVISGYNSRNRVLLTDHAHAGQKYSIGVFGINGPLSDIPDNYIWIRSATLDIYNESPVKASEVHFKDVVQKMDNALDDILSAETELVRIADGFHFTEGPVWNTNGYLLFSDPDQNVIYRYRNGNTTVFRTKSGYKGKDIALYHQPGSNGLAFDMEERLTICEHGNHRITRIEKNGVVTVLADQYEGKRLNSPNDLIYKSDGSLYFTDPPYGLPENFNDKRKELSFSGVYFLKDGKLKLVSKDLKGPNGIAFSPDEKYLYVTDWDITDIDHTKIIMRYEVAADGTLTNGNIFFSMNEAKGEIALDGMEVDLNGNLYATGPGGVWIISSQGKLLGKIVGPELPSNMTWGDDDGKTLYITARTGLYKLRTQVAGKLAAH